MYQATFTETKQALLFTYPEVARTLKISRSAVYLLINSGQLKPVHIGRSARITTAELERFVATLESAL